MRRLGLFLVITWLGSIFLPAFVRAEFADYIRKMRPYVSVQEEYTDSVDLSAKNKEHDFITTASAGIGFSPFSLLSNFQGLNLQPRPEISGLDLAYSIGAVFYARDEDRNYLSHNGSLNAWYNPDRGISLGIRDYLTRSDESREKAYYGTGYPPNDYTIGRQRERAVYLRNVVEPWIGYKFEKDRSVIFTYRNMIYNAESASGEDSQENYFLGTIDYWLNIRHGALLDFAYEMGDFEKSPDFKGNRAHMRYTYRSDPRLSLFLDYSYYIRDFESPGVDYQVNTPRIGFEYSFSRTLKGSFLVGYYWYNPKVGDEQSGPSVNMLLTHLSERTVYSFFFSGGFAEDFYSATNSGATERYRGGFSASHRLGSLTTIGGGASIERNHYLQSGTTEWIWRINANIGYRPLRWLAINFGVSHQECDSDIANGDYKENWALLNISFFYE